jgi:uncharacterized membrane protein YidH (DUF202 family)
MFVGEEVKGLYMTHATSILSMIFRSLLFRFLVVDVLFSLVPGLIAYLLNQTPGRHGEDREILAAWTYCQIAFIVFLVYVYSMPLREPVLNVAAIFATMTPFAYFMQKIGSPIGLSLATLYAPLVGADGRATFASSFTHHIVVGIVTCSMTLILCKLAHSRFQAELTHRQPTHGRSRDGHLVTGHSIDSTEVVRGEQTSAASPPRGPSVVP